MHKQSKIYLVFLFMYGIFFLQMSVKDTNSSGFADGDVAWYLVFSSFVFNLGFTFSPHLFPLTTINYITM